MNREADNNPTENNSSVSTSGDLSGTPSGGDTQEIGVESFQPDVVDISSINALPPEQEDVDSRGEYDRSNTSTPKTQDRSADTESAVEQADRVSAETEDFFIPVLRTYQSDAQDVTDTKGGVELRTTLAKEVEEKRAEQQEYLEKTKDLIKESAVLKDSYRNFKKKKEGGEILTETKTGVTNTKDADLQNVGTTVSGALAYMQSAATSIDEKKESGSESLNDQDKNVDESSLTTEQSNSPAVSEAQPEPKKKKGVFSKIRGRILPAETFSEEERISMKKEQEDIVEKESIDSAWKDFQRKKQELKDRGALMRDVRSYTTTPAGSTPPVLSHRLRQWALVGLVVLLIGSLLFIISSVALRPSEVPNNTLSDSSDDLQTVKDVVSNEHKKFVDVSATPNTWPAIVERDEEPGTVTKFVPYEMRDGRSVQIGLDDFNLNFIMRIPPGLRETFGDYYFVGRHSDESTANGIFIVSVQDYSDALVWMLNWEKNAINSFISVFPDTFNRSNPENTSATSTIIDNKDVRILRNPLSDTPLMYYFFNRSLLVFVVGSERTIPFINDRIRSANAQ